MLTSCYSQHHLLPKLREQLRHLGGMDLTVLDYDACTTMWVRDWDDLERFHLSDDFKKLQVDCQAFMDLTPGSLKAMVGYAAPARKFSDGCIHANYFL